MEIKWPQNLEKSSQFDEISLKEEDCYTVIQLNHGKTYKMEKINKRFFGT